MREKIEILWYSNLQLQRRRHFQWSADGCPLYVLSHSHCLRAKVVAAETGTQYPELFPSEWIFVYYSLHFLFQENTKIGVYIFFLIKLKYLFKMGLGSLKPNIFVG